LAEQADGCLTLSFAKDHQEIASWTIIYSSQSAIRAAAGATVNYKKFSREPQESAVAFLYSSRLNELGESPLRLVVQKFGGTSVANAQRIMAAARRAIRAKQEGNQVIVVVSARGDTTDD
jgi:hypothetical protein